MATFMTSWAHSLHVESLWNGGIVVALISTICLLFVLVYRLFFSPLARYPGAFVSRLTAWPNWYHACKGDRHTWLHQQHIRYGPVVRFTPDALSFNTSSAVESIYRSRKANVIKADWYQGVRDSAGGYESTFTARDRARHSVKRRLLSQAFSEHALKDYEPRIVELVTRWMDELDREANRCGGCVDVGEWAKYLSLDVLGDLCFGQSFGLMDSNDNRFVAGLVPQATRSWYTLGYHPFSHTLRYMLFKTPAGSYLSGEAYQQNGRFRDFCLAALKRCKQANGSPLGKNDMFHHLFNGHDPETGKTYSTGDLACESVLLMVAGSQSTAAAIAATVFYLIHSPGRLMRLQRELHRAFSSEHFIRYEPSGELGKLSYLRACIDESMRLTPPTPGHLPREVAHGGLRIDDIWLPSGTIVGVSPYAVHRNETYFVEADRFKPERWLHDDGSVNDFPAFNAFSAGMTGCMGKQLAYMEISLVIARLVHRFDLRALHSPSGNHVDYNIRDVFVGEGTGPQARLSRVQSV